MQGTYDKQRHVMHNYDDFFNENIRRLLMIIFQLGKTYLIGLNLFKKMNIKP